jgi:hypothetical protein
MLAQQVIVLIEKGGALSSVEDAAGLQFQLLGYTNCTPYAHKLIAGCTSCNRLFVDRLFTRRTLVEVDAHESFTFWWRVRGA